MSVVKPSGPIDLLKDQWVCCAAGHKICQADSDLRVGDHSWESRLVNWQQPKPRDNTPFSPDYFSCEKCGEPYLVGSERDERFWFSFYRLEMA